MLPTAREWKRSILATLRGAGFGCFFGPLPGTGPTVATIASYATERRLSRRPEKFGEGAIEGIAAPESANNRSEEHTSELQSLMRNSYAVFCLKNKNNLTYMQ